MDSQHCMPKQRNAQDGSQREAHLELIQACRLMQEGWERILEALESMASVPLGTGEQDLSPCKNCQDRDTCQQLCDRVKKLTRDPYAGRSRQEYLPGLRDNIPGAPYHTADLCRPSREVYEMLLQIQHVFLRPQWQVLELRHGAGMPTAEIASTLRITPAAVRGRLQRARKRIEAEQKSRSGTKPSET